MTGKDALEAIYRLAAKEFGKEEHDAQVVELLGQYLELHPKHVFSSRHRHAWTLFGDALLGIGRAREAFPILMTAFEKAPEQSRGHVASSIARLLEEYVSPRQAKKWHKAATDYCGRHEGWPWVFRGANFAVLGEFRKAIACYERAIEVDRACDKDEAWLNMGYCYRALREYENALLCFEQALSLEPCNKPAKTALHALNDLAATLSGLESAAASEPGREAVTESL
ncbi:MAG: tetratricopeptide repeat protein [Azoarcus sp.]|jgi:tetratricopeptide (TPR) repeat protein|nr:tetratricopeptide repeat protein [Azoarcus sp.]